MAYYKILWKQAARKELIKLDKKRISKVISAVEQLSENPRPQNSKKMSGSQSTCRIRIDDYRIIYEVFNETVERLVIRIGHRKDVYRNL